MVRSSVFKRLAVVSTMTLVALTAAACGGDDSSTADGGDSGDSGDSSGTDIGVILPDATTSPRWEANDKPSLSAAFDAAGVSYDIQNAQGSVETFGTLCDQMIGEGVKVLMIVNLDQESGKACLDKATDAGVQSIDYDRLTPGGGAALYVSFDNVKVGELQADYLVKRKPTGNYILIGGAPTDHNAKLVREGQLAALDDAVKRGDIRIVADPWAVDWQADAAMTLTETALKKAGGQVVAVVASNDTTAGGAIQALEKRGLAGKVLVSGQDANLDAVRRIVAGTQTMTVYKPLRPLARGAAQAAVQLAKGEKVEGTATVNNGMKEVQAFLLNPISIRRDLIDQLIISDQFHTREQVYGTGGQK